jgi:hypothetical protein
VPWCILTKLLKNIILLHKILENWYSQNILENNDLEYIRIKNSPENVPYYFKQKKKYFG